MEADLIAARVAAILFVADAEAFIVLPGSRNDMAVALHVADSARLVIGIGNGVVVSLFNDCRVCCCGRGTHGDERKHNRQGCERNPQDPVNS
jgi:hypothetical protein